MSQRIVSCLFVCLVSMGLFGCDSGENKNVMENADLSALQEYERLIEADNASMSTSDDSATE